MTNIIDRRKNPSGKSLGSRQRFIQRAKEQVRKAVNDAVGKTNIKDFGKGTVRVPVSNKDLSEPTFNHDTGTGHRKAVIPGNKDYVEGDQIDKPDDGEGGGSGASRDGDGEDEFEFALTKEEFIDFFFEDLELPNLAEKEMKELLEMAPKRAGYTSTGSPSNLSVAATVKKSIGRRIALKRPKQDEIDALKAKLSMSVECLEDLIYVREIEEEIARLESRMRGIPYITSPDLRYRNFIQQPKPNTSALMICLMDVSGSMGEREKDIAKRFYILLWLLLHKKYETVEIKFVRHHHVAEICTEEDFFYKRDSGGTLVSEGMKLVNQIIDAHPPSQWNVYVAQASDGDNDESDMQDMAVELEKVLARTNYYAYLDIPSAFNLSMMRSSQLWNFFKEVERVYDRIGIARARDQSDIWAVFQELFEKDKK
jgi:uncharacterized protein